MDQHQAVERDVDTLMREIARYLRAYDGELLYKQASFETLADVHKRVDPRILDGKALHRAFLVHA